MSKGCIDPGLHCRLKWGEFFPFDKNKTQPILNENRFRLVNFNVILQTPFMNRLESGLELQLEFTNATSILLSKYLQGSKVAN